jgi:hypothetical protein
MLGVVPFGYIFKADCILDYFSYMNSLLFCCADGQGNMIVSFVLSLFECIFKACCILDFFVI